MEEAAAREAAEKEVTLTKALATKNKTKRRQKMRNFDDSRSGSGSCANGLLKGRGVAATIQSKEN